MDKRNKFPRIITPQKRWSNTFCVLFAFCSCVCFVFLPRPALQPIPIGSFSCKPNELGPSCRERSVGVMRKGRKTSLFEVYFGCFSLRFVLVVFAHVQNANMIVQESYCSSNHELGENFWISSRFLQINYLSFYAAFG